MTLSEQGEKLVEVERRDAVELVTLNRSAEQNALNLAMVGELTRIFTGLQNDFGVRTVILTGAGESFSTGTDIKEMTAWTPEQAKEYARTAQQLTSLLENSEKPVIASVNGQASGSGCELALACTWRVASANATFVQPEVSLGRLPGFGGATRLPKMIGKASAGLQRTIAPGKINFLEGLERKFFGMCRRNQPGSPKLATKASATNVT